MRWKKPWSIGNAILYQHNRFLDYAIKCTITMKVENKKKLKQNMGNTAQDQSICREQVIVM